MFVLRNILNNFSEVTLFVDFGLVVLIWLVQLIIYPSFLYYQKENLINWHRIYTSRIFIIVVPLMVVQLLLSIISIYININLESITSFVIILLLWSITFTFFAPLHFKISGGEISLKQLNILVKLNWVRTILWSILFLIRYLGLL